MFNIFLAVFFATLAFAFVEPFFFIGYLISIAIFGLYQAIFMANAGGACGQRQEDRRESSLSKKELHCTTPRSSATRSAIHSRTHLLSPMNPGHQFTNACLDIGCGIGV